MAMFSQLRNCNIMHYITEMHVMSITFQLLLHYNKFKLVSFQNLTEEILNSNSNNYISECSIFGTGVLGYIYLL